MNNGPENEPNTGAANTGAARGAGDAGAANAGAANAGGANAGGANTGAVRGADDAGPTGLPGDTTPGASGTGRVDRADQVDRADEPEGRLHGDESTSDLPGDGLPADELGLRRLMHDAVGGLQPSDEALAHLRTAIPARRARKRQALVGAAAAALLFGTAVPAFLHVAGVSDTADTPALSAGHDENATSGTWPDGGRTGAAERRAEHEGGAQKPSDSAEAAPKPHSGGSAVPGHGSGDGAHSGPSASPGSTSPLTLPVCSANQLGVTASKNPPTSNGTVYGSFHVSNVSGSECTVTGGDTLGFMATGAADPTKISVVQHTAGDPATQLPDAPEDTSPMALAPATAYEVRFAFVPSATCPTGNDVSADPTPSGDTPDKPPSNSTPGTGSDAAVGVDPSAGTEADTETSGSEGLSTQLVADGEGPGGGSQDGSVSVSHTPEAGVPKAETTIPNACAGTIYKTGPVDAPAA